MMGLTYFMLDQSRKEAEYCMENAFNTYLVCQAYFDLNISFSFHLDVVKHFCSNKLR